DPTPAAPAEMEQAPAQISSTDVVTNGLVYNYGTITANHPADDTEKPGQGGEVTLAGVRVGQYGTINANGTSGGGGTVNILATQVILMTSNSVTTADAGAD